MLAGSLQRQLEQLVSQKASANEIAALAGLCQMVAGMDTDHWKDSLGTLARLASDPFPWLTAGESALLRFGASRQIAIALTDCWPFQSESIEEGELKTLLGSYVTWLATQSDDRVCAFCWAILRAQPRRQGSISQSPIYWLVRQGRLKGDIELPSIELAVALTDEESAMFWWPEERWLVTDWTSASKPYFHFLDHPSSLVRAAAAKTLGRLHTGLRNRIDTPAITDLLAMISTREAKAPGVAGPFLEGSDWGIDDWADILGSFDMRGWFLHTLRNSDRELDWPEAQALEFYAQEFLSDDGDAIEQMLDMGREDLALMTATSVADNVELLRPVLEAMARSENPKIAAAMQSYLAEHGQSSGRQWLN